MENKRKVALITGITGQDGSYLTELLLKKDYEVHGLVRRVALESGPARFSRINHLLENKNLILHSGDITNYATVWQLINKVRPDEVYHLAAIASITESFNDELGTMITNVSGTHYLLSALRDVSPKSRFYFAATSDLFSGLGDSPQDEQARFAPTTPYGVSKASGLYLTKFYRDTHYMFACSGIAFSHESPRRGFEFVTRKISLAVARIKSGKEKTLRLGNLDARRDWGFAGDYVEAMWLMLQADKPDDYVIGTGKSHTIREFVEAAFKFVGLDSKDYVSIDESLFRPGEAREWLANPKKIENALRWKAKTNFQDLVQMMVESDLKNV
ncbi:MAG: GDP-mannose 4,6-dehydratase [Patescibacteria group bacterium]